MNTSTYATYIIRWFIPYGPLLLHAFLLTHL